MVDDKNFRMQNKGQQTACKIIEKEKFSSKVAKLAVSKFRSIIANLYFFFTRILKKHVDVQKKHILQNPR